MDRRVAGRHGSRICDRHAGKRTPRDLAEVARSRLSVRRPSGRHSERLRILGTTGLRFALADRPRFGSHACPPR
ncbi:MAG: hypothetical protein OXG81_14990 [Acidobacteria bacterium]|nr:hypothetical protein [Acidobacteriota bacterium]